MSDRSWVSDGLQGVPKLASDGSRFWRRALLYDSGRLAIKAFVQAAGTKPGDTVLCPAYVGWSPREGAGVVDPLRALGILVDFYRVGRDLAPDLDHLELRLKGSKVAGGLFIHFFGHIQPNYADAVRLMHKWGAWVLEDCAHALFTDLVTGVTGRLGDASVLSLHKLLPVSSGGALLLNSSERWARAEFDAPEVPQTSLWGFDLPAIAAKRRCNTAALAELLGPLAGRADPLWPQLRDEDIMQTYPVLLPRANRDRVYEQMNARGYGVVSLYHTLVTGISPEDYPLSHALSTSILNLPVHQDLQPAQLADLVAHLGTVLDESEPELEP